MSKYRCIDGDFYYDTAYWEHGPHEWNFYRDNRAPGRVFLVEERTQAACRTNLMKRCGAKFPEKPLRKVHFKVIKNRDGIDSMGAPPDFILDLVLELTFRRKRKSWRVMNDFYYDNFLKFRGYML